MEIKIYNVCKWKVEMLKINEIITRSKVKGKISTYHYQFALPKLILTYSFVFTSWQFDLPVILKITFVFAEGFSPDINARGR